MSPSVLPYLWYPLLFVSAVLGFAGLLAAKVPLLAAAYLPVILAGISIMLLERRFPERLDWRPQWDDIRADAAFMLLVQVALPRILMLVCVLLLARWLHDRLPSPAWPHGWPLAGQIAAMVLLVDLVRYWLHRACHRFPLLWRLHEVHHSPNILYTLNVGRFHPLEKGLHFCCDSLPFLLLGVAPEVIAGYFLLYSVNGFFQHSNLKLRYGWLNYLVGSAETHRWHHARDPKTASCNFGNTTIVWDLLFGTWHLPRNGGVGEIGIMDQAYPKGFMAQMLVPFRRTRFTQVVSDVAIRACLRGLSLAHARQIAVHARSPMKAQHALLTRILADNQAMVFGKEHGFAAITSHADFAHRVPVSDYEMLRPYVERQMNGEAALCAETPLQYLRTSGTTGKPKDIPLTPSHLKALRRIQQAAVARQYRACPQAIAGDILAINSPACEGWLPGGQPFGSASGIVASNTPALVRSRFVLPDEVLTIADSRLKYLLILRLALAKAGISYIGSANPSTLLTMMELFREHHEALIDDVRRGGFFLSGQLPAEVLEAVAGRLHACPRRGAALQEMAKRGEMRIADLWPSLAMVVCWTCASAGIAVQALRRQLAARTLVFELGYVASEMRGTVTLGRRSGSGFPTLDTHFFEFVERPAWDERQEGSEMAFLTLEQLRKGVEYYVIVTTPAGLYRYFINDLVRVRDFLHHTPLLQFVQKGKGVTNITGEKLYEAQALAAVRAVTREAGVSPYFWMMLADEEARCYRLYLEDERKTKPDCAMLAQAVDQALCTLNLEYCAKRESGRLGELTVRWLRTGSFEAYKSHCVAQGQREGQFKTVALAYRRSFGFDLEAFLEEE